MSDFGRIPGLFGFMTEACAPGFNHTNEFAHIFFSGVNDGDKWIACNIETPFGIAGLIKRNTDDGKRSGNYASNELYSVLFEGEFFSNDGRRREVDWLLDLITVGGIDELNDLNGNYMVAIHDVKRSAFILRSDRYATRSLYYSFINRKLIFASDFRYVLRPQPIMDSINYEAILDFIDFEFILNNETFHSEIKVLGHGEQLIWDGRALRLERYWDYPLVLPSSQDARPEDFILETHKALERAISRRIEGKSSIGVTLSSGMDSRAIAAYIASMRNEPLNCYHLGQPGHKCSKWAEDICRSIGGMFESVALDHLEFERLLDATYRLLAGQVSLNQANILWLLSSKDVKNTYILDGQVQDTLLHSQYITTNLRSNGSPDSYIDDLFRLHNPMPLGLLKIVLKEQWAQKAISRRKQRIAQHLQGRVFENKSALTQYFYYTARGPRYVWGAPVLEFSLVDIGFPGMDYDLFDWAMEIPVELRGADAKIYRAILCRYFPEVARIPWDATGKPLSVFKSRIKEDYSLAGKEFWYYVIRRMSRGKIDLFNRFLDKDRLFRTNKEFRDAFLRPTPFIDSFPNSPIAEDAVERLTKMVDEGRNYFEALQKIVTVLNYFQACAGSE